MDNERLDNLYDKNEADKWAEAKTMEHASGIWGRDPMLAYLKNEVIKEGDVVVDLGAGAGYPTMRVAQMVGETGKVFGVEKSWSMLGLDDGGERSVDVKYQKEFPNLYFYPGDATETGIGPNFADKIVSFMVLHNLPIELVQGVFKETERILKQDGLGVFLTMSPKAHESDWDVDFMGYEAGDLQKLKEADDKEGIKIKGFVKNSGGGTKQIGMFHHTEENLQKAILDAGLEIVSEKEIFVDEKTAKERFGEDSVRKMPQTPIFVIITVRKPAK